MGIGSVESIHFVDGLVCQCVPAVVLYVAGASSDDDVAGVSVVPAVGAAG